MPDADGLPVPGDGAVPHAFVADLDAPELAPDDHHHLSRVLRLRAGDLLTVSDGAGRWRACRFGDGLEVVGAIGVEPPRLPAVTIAFALVKGERPELVVQKLTELGVDRIVPFRAARSVVRWDDERAARQAERLARVAREAAVQCRRCRLPEVAVPATFAEVVSLPGAVAADRGGVPPSLDRPTILIGPEGGWADEERAAFGGTVGLGDHVLRAETAAITAAALLGALRAGLLGGPTDGRSA